MGTNRLTHGRVGGKKLNFGILNHEDNFQRATPDNCLCKRHVKSYSTRLSPFMTAWEIKWVQWVQKVDFPSLLVKEDIAWILSTSWRQFRAIKSLNSIMTWSLSCWNLVFQVRTSYCLPGRISTRIFSVGNVSSLIPQ